MREMSRVLAADAPVYHCYWHGSGDMEFFDGSSETAPPFMKKRAADDVDAIFLDAGFQKTQGRLDTYEWGDMCFAMYSA